MASHPGRSGLRAGGAGAGRGSRGQTRIAAPPRRPQPADHGRRCQLVVSAFPADHTGPVELTTSGMVHFAAGMVAFVGLAVAAPLLTRHLVTPRRPRAALLRGLAVAAPVGLAVYAATTVLGETARRPVRPPLSPRAGRARHGRRVRGIAGHGGAQPHPGGPEPAHRGSRPSRLLAIAVGITGSGSRPARSHLSSHPQQTTPLRHNPTPTADASRPTGRTHAARLGIDAGTVLGVESRLPNGWCGRPAAGTTAPCQPSASRKASISRWLSTGSRTATRRWLRVRPGKL
jgi:hypothetical protein